MTLQRTLQLVSLGPIHEPPSDFVRMTDPAGDGFEGVPDPLGSGRTVIRNVNRSGQSDGHTTLGTGRSLEKGSTSYVAFDWLYQKPEDLQQTARNLVAQLQMDGSPIWAISTKDGEWQIVDRVGGKDTRTTLGPVPWGRWAYFVVGTRLADSDGFVNASWAVDDWPDLAQDERAFVHVGDTWQGRTGHHTLGQYSAHSGEGAYTGYFSRFGRDATPEKAIDLAGAVTAPTPTPERPTRVEALAALDLLRRYVG